MLLILPQPNCFLIRHLWYYKEGKAWGVKCLWLPLHGRHLTAELCELWHTWPWKHMVISLGLMRVCCQWGNLKVGCKGVSIIPACSPVISQILSWVLSERKHIRAERRVLLLKRFRPWNFLTQEIRVARQQCGTNFPNLWSSDAKIVGGGRKHDRNSSSPLTQRFGIRPIGGFSVEIYQRLTPP